MKLKKVFFLPLMLVALTSCNLGGGPTPSTGTSDGGGVSETSVPAGTSEVIDLEEANTRVAAALDKFTEEEITSLELSLDADFSMEQALFDLEDMEVESEAVTVDASAEIKAKDLDKPTAQLAASVGGMIQMKEDGMTTGEINGDLELYYVDEFVYVSADAMLIDVSQPESLTLDTKQKMEVGPFPGLDFEDELPEEVEDIVDINLDELDLILDLLGGNVTAVEDGDAVTLTYTFRQDDLFDLFIAMAFGEAELSAEELADARALFNDLFTLRKAIISISINADGFLSGIDLELDVTLKEFFEDWDEAEQDYVILGYGLISISAEVSLELAVNEPVTITFPSFDGYELVDEIVLIEN